jgi:hypothetical protein
MTQVTINVDSERKRKALEDLLAKGGEPADALLLWAVLGDAEAMLADIEESSFDDEDAIEPVGVMTA